MWPAVAQPSPVILQGTWQFLSTKLCEYERKKHQLQDDLESFVHTVMYTTLRYMRSDYSQARLQDTMAKIYDKGGDIKISMFISGLSDYMYSPLVLPDAPPLVNWIETACELGREWLFSKYSKVIINRTTRVTTLLESGPVPETIGFHDHTALIELWKSTLDSEEWNKVTPQPAHDNLVKTAIQRESKGKTESLQLPPSEIAVTVQSDTISSDKPPITTSRKRGSQQNPERKSKRPRTD